MDFNFEKEVKNGDMIIDIISKARGEKTNHNVSLKTPIRQLKLNVSEELKEAILESIKDFKATLFIQNLEIEDQKEEYSIEKIELEIEE